MNIFRRQIVLALVGVILSSDVQSHHSVPAKFDTGSDHTISGVIKTVQWANPHSWLVVEIINANGDPESWRVEMNALETIRHLGARMGFSMTEFVVGDSITVSGWLGHDKRSIYFRNATLTSGKQIIWQRKSDPDSA